MPVNPALDAWRTIYVEEKMAQQKALRQQQTDDLEKARLRLAEYLRKTDSNQIVKAILFDLHLKITATKSLKGELPLEGESIDGYLPVFVVDHQGLPGFKQRFEIPGYRYSFHLGIDEVTITITFCQGVSGSIFPYFRLTHRNGRNHQLDWNVHIENPDNSQLNYWLFDQIGGLISKRYPSQVVATMASSPEPISKIHSFLPDEDEN